MYDFFSFQKLDLFSNKYVFMLLCLAQAYPFAVALRWTEATVLPLPVRLAIRSVPSPASLSTCQTRLTVATWWRV